MSTDAPPRAKRRLNCGGVLNDKLERPVGVGTGTEHTDSEKEIANVLLNFTMSDNSGGMSWSLSDSSITNKITVNDQMDISDWNKTSSIHDSDWNKTYFDHVIDWRKTDASDWMETSD